MLSSEYLCSNSYCVIRLCVDALRATRLEDGISGHDKRVTAAFERFLDQLGKSQCSIFIVDTALDCLAELIFYFL